MAKRRMISLDVYDTDDFIEMLSDPRDLYTQLLVRSDDDGFNGKTKSIMRMFDLKEDALKTLIAKGFVLEFASGVIVISDWATQNTMRKDRYKSTTFIQERNLLQKDENGKWQPRIDAPLELFSQRSIPIITKLKRDLKSVSTTWQPDGNQLVPQYRLGKVSIGQVKDDDEYNQSLEIQKSPEAFPKMTIAELLADNPQVEGLVNDLFSDLIVDNPDQAFEAINAVVGQYWRLRTLLDDGNEILMFKEQVHGKGKGILAVIQEASVSQLEYMKPRLANFNMFGRYFENGLIDRVNTAISSGGISNGN